MLRVSRIPLMTHDSVLFLMLRCLDVHFMSFFVVVFSGFFFGYGGFVLR